MSEPAENDILALMAALADQVPVTPVASAAFGLARFLAENHTDLTDRQQATLTAIGAALWQRSIDLGDTVPEIDAILATKQ